MKPDDNDSVYDFFEAAVQDCTPAAARHVARVLHAPTSSDPEVIRRCSTVISNVELERANTFLDERDKNNFIQRRAFRRFCGAVALGSMPTSLSQIAFDETDEGRPYISSMPEISFSFSSCRLGLLGAWSSTHAVGVDIEDRTQDLEMRELAQQFFSDDEAVLIDESHETDRVRTFFQLWSLKESALKSIGEGLPFGLDAFTFALSPDVRLTSAPNGFGGADSFDPHIIQQNSTCAALVMHSSCKK